MIYRVRVPILLVRRARVEDLYSKISSRGIEIRIRVFTRMIGISKMQRVPHITTENANRRN